MINYQKVLNKNLLNVLKDILKNIQLNGVSGNNQLYITFLTNHKDNKISNWIKEKHPKKMTIVIQYEYYDIKINEKSFNITLSFNNIKTKLKIAFDAIISFADPSANFGLVLQEIKIEKKIIKKQKKDVKFDRNNVINFSNYKKK